MRFKCIIVDDELPAINILKKYVGMVPQLEVIGTCNNAFQAIEILNSEKVDLIFLDINMPKLSGTQLVNTLQYPPKVIFATAHKDYAIAAFDLDAIDYLLKPISFERFLKAVNKFCHLNNVHMDKFTKDPGFLYFRSDRKMIKVFLDEILYIESRKDYISIHRQSNSDIKVKKTLNSVEDMLPQNLFLRIHRSYIVSIAKVTAYTKNDVEIGNIELPFGRNYSEIFLKLFPNNPNILDDK